jgi:hypothetical protein
VWAGALLGGGAVLRSIGEARAQELAGFGRACFGSGAPAELSGRAMAWLGHALLPVAGAMLLGALVGAALERALFGGRAARASVWLRWCVLGGWTLAVVSSARTIALGLGQAERHAVLETVLAAISSGWSLLIALSVTAGLWEWRRARRDRLNETLADERERSQGDPRWRAERRRRHRELIG